MSDSRARVWTSSGPRPCKVCKALIQPGDRWYSGLGVARACATCGPRLEADLQEQADQEATAATAERLEHRRAVRQAYREGLTLR